MVACMLRIPQIIPRLRPIASPHRAGSLVSLEFPVWSHRDAANNSNRAAEEMLPKTCTSGIFVPGKGMDPDPLGCGFVQEVFSKWTSRISENRKKDISNRLLPRLLGGGQRSPEWREAPINRGGKFEVRCHAGNAGHIEVASDSVSVRIGQWIRKEGKQELWGSLLVECKEQGRRIVSD